MDFQYTVNADSDEPIMLIDRHIGYDKDDGFGIMGDVFQRELLFLDTQNKKRISVWINSPGGVVSDGELMYNAILKTKTKVDTYCIGTAASIAAVLFQAGRKRIMCDFSKLMYHGPSGPGDDVLEVFRKSLSVMISSRVAGKTPDEISALMCGDNWMDAEDALANGFCDEIESSADYNRPRQISKDENVKSAWKKNIECFNSLLPNKNITMTKVTNKLNLVDGSSDDVIVAAIGSIEDKLKIAVTKNSSDDAEMENLRNQISDLTDKLNKMTEAKNAVENENKAAIENAAKIEVTNKATLIIDKAIADGKIKNETVKMKNVDGVEVDSTTKDVWINKFVADPSGTEMIINSLTFNKKAVAFPEKTKSTTVEAALNRIDPNDTRAYMAAFNAKNLAKAKARYTPNV